MRKTVIPAIIAGNQRELSGILERVGTSADTVQLDVMDGRFVPSTSLDFDFILPPKKLGYEAHLMVEDPLDWIKRNFIKVDTILAPIESCQNPLEVIGLARDKNKRVGFALNPKTPVNEVTAYLDELDQVLVMTVKPGFYGSPFLPETLSKVKEIRALKKDLDIEVDGGITPDTIRQALEAGANMFVSGSYVVKSGDPGEAIDELRARLE